jgi:zinc transport system permease protein
MNLQTLEYLQYSFVHNALIAAVLVATSSALLSSIVVLKRLAFVGQGISHAAFGGIGVVAILGLGGLSGELTVFVFCLASAMLIAGMSRGRTREDTAIGIVLVSTMALGFLLMGLRQKLMQQPWYAQWLGDAPSMASWDTVLFGSVHLAGPMGAWLSFGVAVVVIAALLWCRRPMLAYVFDETAARAAGVSVHAMRGLLMVLLAMVVVVGMKLVGVVLISALLVLPGAIAAQLTRRLLSTVVIAWCTAIIGIVGGLILSFELELLSGPCIVLVLVAQFAVAMLIGRTRL